MILAYTVIGLFFLALTGARNECSEDEEDSLR